jgi:arylsulfatase A-like enzyme
LTGAAPAASLPGLVEHDMHVGKLLAKVDELGIGDNMIVFYSTDNGPHYNTWPDAAATPFRGEKNTNWERALRYRDWKMVFMEQKTVGTFRVWMDPFVPLRVPLIFNLRRDPYERAEITSNTYYDWLLDRAYLLVPAQAFVGEFLKTFIEYPPRQKAASFSLDQVMEKLSEPGSH